MMTCLIFVEGALFGAAADAAAGASRLEPGAEQAVNVDVTNAEAMMTQGNIW